MSNDKLDNNYDLLTWKELQQRRGEVNNKALQQDQAFAVDRTNATSPRAVQLATTSLWSHK